LLTLLPPISPRVQATRDRSQHPRRLAPQALAPGYYAEEPAGYCGGWFAQATSYCDTDALFREFWSCEPA
jgi:hypothetical protein